MLWIWLEAKSEGMVSGATYVFVSHLNEEGRWWSAPRAQAATGKDGIRFSNALTVHDN